MDEIRLTPAQGRMVPSDISSPVSRRTFLAGAAASLVSYPVSSGSELKEPASAFLHLAAYSSGTAHVHTCALIADRCHWLGSTAIDSLAAYAAHPVHPVLYMARDCAQWNHLPCGVIETYAVENSTRPLQLLAQTPMALSATGPRSLAVSSCGKHLLVSASTGGAWNAFALDSNGIPASLAIARKETAALLKPGTIASPMPHAVAFSPQAPYAVGTDPGSERITLLQPSTDGIAVLSRCEMPPELASSSPVWTADGRYVLAANAQIASLSVYAIHSEKETIQVNLVESVSTQTPVRALLAHPAQPGVFTSRSQNKGSRIEFWKIQGDRLQAERDVWVPQNILALAQQADILWLVAEDRLIRMQSRNLLAVNAWKLPLSLRGAHSVRCEARLSV